MQIRRATRADVDHWARMRAALWPSATFEDHLQEVNSHIDAQTQQSVVFIAVDESGSVCAFAEASLRRDYVNGCDTSPVAFLEGVYTSPAHQGCGVGRRLCACVEAWARECGCSELASDALLENVESHRFHTAIGFDETERVVYFRKNL